MLRHRNAPAALQPASSFEGRWRTIGLGLALVVALGFVYFPALRGEFLWDDGAHIGKNPTIVGPLGLREIWTTPEANYSPLVFTSFWLQYATWGLNTLPYHIVTLVFHALSALLLWRLLRRLQVPGAWFGAAIWALHPVQVESVAWICELKNTQSAFFYLLAIFGYVRWLELEEPAEGKRRKLFYGLTLLAALAAILSKPSTVMLPVVLALCTWWQRGRLRLRDLVWLIPFLALSAGVSGWTIWEQKFHSGAIGASWNQTWPERCLIAGRTVWFYLGKLFWPSPLIFHYPRWQIDATRWSAWLPPIALLAVIGALWRNRTGPARPVFIAAVYFGALLFPVLGFFSIYFYRYSFVGDHFQYLASMGPLVLVGAALAKVGERFTPALLRLRPLLAIVLLTVLGALSWRHAAAFRNVEALWRDTLAKNPGSAMAWTNLGDELVLQNRHQEAAESFAHGLEFDPKDANGFNQLGVELVLIGRPLEAIPALERSLQLRPAHAETLNNLGNALRDVGRSAEAIAHYEQALRLQPDYAPAHNNLGCELAATGRPAEALVHFETALRLKPSAVVLDNLGNALRDLGRIDEALAHYQDALRLQPDFVEAESNLALTLAAVGRLPEALPHFETALRLRPDLAKVHAAFAMTLAQSGRWSEAVGHFETAAKLAPNDAEFASGFGVALANVGRLPEAAVQFERSLQLRPGAAEIHQNLGEVLRALGRRLEAIEHFDEALRLQQMRH